MPSSEYSPMFKNNASPRNSDDSLRALELTEGPSFLNPRGRSYSVSGFQFESLPLTSSLSEPIGLNGGDISEKKQIGLMKGIALCVGVQIGSGIFSSPGIVVESTQSVGASLLVWLAGGLLAWTGASSFAELGASIPVNGGPQAYLAYAYGPLMSYLFTWGSIFLKPGANAVISLIFAEYLNKLFFHATSSDASSTEVPQWAIKVTAIVAVIVVSILCVASPSLGPRTAVVFTTVKVAALALVCVLGLVQLARGKASTSLTNSPFEGSSTSPGSYALAFYSGLWAYDGWDQANYVGGEMVNPEKNLPWVIHCSMGLVTLLFMLANLAYFVVLDKNIVASSNTVALDFGRALFGPVGGVVFAAMVAVSCFGALNGSFFTAARLIHIAGKEGYLPGMFGRLHSSLKTPVNAMALQAGITIVFISLGEGFRSLINFAVVVSWMAYFLTVLGLVILRIKEPQLERPYKTWITTPLLFCAVALFLLCMPIIAAPLPSMAVIGFVLLGIPMYYITQRNEDLPHAFSVFSDCFARLRGRPDVGSGWQAVATDGDEQVEMVEGHR